MQTVRAFLQAVRQLLQGFRRLLQTVRATLHSTVNRDTHSSIACNAVRVISESNRQQNMPSPIPIREE